MAKNIWSYGDEKDGYMIIGFDHDDIAIEEGEEPKKAGITFAVSDVGRLYKSIYTSSPNTTWVSYKDSSIYYVLDKCYERTMYDEKFLIPEDLKKYIKLVRKKYYISNSAASVRDLDVHLFAFAVNESTDYEYTEGRYGDTDGEKYEGLASLIDFGYYWTRTPSPTYSQSKWYVNSAKGYKGPYAKLRSESLYYQYGFCI